MKKGKLLLVLFSLVAVFGLISCQTDTEPNGGTEEVVQYSVRFIATDFKEVEVKVNSGAKVAKPSDPTRQGYIFDGWFLDLNYTKPFDFENTCIYENISLYGKWKKEGEEPVIKTYMVSFESDGGSVVESQTIEAGKKAVRPVSPTKEGYLFMGWFKDDNKTQEFDFTTEIINKDIILYAKWEKEPESLTVYFNSKEGSAVDPIRNIPSGSKIERPSDPVREGYRFVGWFKDTGGTLTVEFDFATEVITKSITLYAKWESLNQTYVVDFDTKDGTTILHQEVSEGECAVQPADPYKEGYTFAGWYSDVDCTIAYNFATPVTKNTVIYAKWEKQDEDSITNFNFSQFYTEASKNLDGNGKTTIAITQGKFMVGAGVKAEASMLNTQGKDVIFTLNGKLSNGVKITGTGGSSAEDTVVSLYKLVNEKYELVEVLGTVKNGQSGNFSKDGLEAGTYKIATSKSLKITVFTLTELNRPTPSKTYTVTFDSQGGSSVAQQVIQEGNCLQKPVNPNREGFIFVGWYKESACINAWNFETDPVDAEMTLYAKWEDEPINPDATTYTICFETNGGNSLEDKLVEEGKKLNKPNNPVRAGYKFIGWYLEDTFDTTYNFDAPVTKDFTLYAYWEIEEYVVTFVGTSFEALVLPYGSKVPRPAVNPSRNGYTFEGWFKNNTYTEEFIFEEEVIVGSTSIFAKWVRIAVPEGEDQGELENGTGKPTVQGSVRIAEVSGLNESAYIIFDKVSGSTAYEYYLSDSEGNLKKVDQKIAYAQSISNSQMRVDFMGLAAGTYEAMILPTGEASVEGSRCEFTVVAYDRSGYAHFKNSEGVGAYKDDGTLKDDAIVIYVTDANKDTVMGDIPELQKYMYTIPGSDWGGKKALGIGWWLNNAQYTKKDSSGNPGNTYNANGFTLGFYSVTEDHPVVIRFVGRVTTPEGCTAYNSLNEGGSVGDNGHMARMKDLKNITLEGVGFDAVIDGWGFHFMTSDRSGTRGRNFEARNLTFTQYPEDAIGMEGVQEGSTIVASVERCWIHHCTFLPGYCANPAESDKKEGDGSCDFKRGQYYTLSYCYFEYCHKTNLVGSSDSSLQYNISMHHNIWYQCGSRIPLLRQANLHFYNNYVYADPNDRTASLSYVSSLRANCYMYSENNYFEGCKQVFDGKSGGTAKCFNNTYLGCYSSDIVHTYTVNTREAQVNSNCKYQNISYANFDTNADLFYYNSTEKKSDCYLTSSTVARQECIQFAGSYYRTKLNETSLKSDTYDSNKYVVSDSIDLSSESYTATIGTNEKGIIYNGVGNTGKFKGQGVTFRLTDAALVDVIMTHSSAALFSGALVRSDGRVMLNGSGKVLLEPGLYYIVSCEFDKETTLTTLTFEKQNSEELNQKLIAEYNQRVAEIPNPITYTRDCYSAIEKARALYLNMGVDLRPQVDYVPVQKAFDEYVALGKVYVENLIDAIGEVNVNSGLAIQMARTAYNDLRAISKTVNISNYEKLTKAETQFVSFAVEACIEKINAIGTVTLASGPAIEAARAAYEALDVEQKALVTNIKVLDEAEAAYANLYEIAHIEELIESVDKESLTSMKEVLTAYDALTDVQKESVISKDKISEIRVAYLIMLIDSIGVVTEASGEVITEADTIYNNLTNIEQDQITNYGILEAAKEAYEEIKAKQHIKTFDDGIADKTGFFSITGNLQGKGANVTYNGVTYKTAMKMESSTSISFTITAPTTLVIVSTAVTKRIKVNGTTYTSDASGIFTIELTTAGMVSIAKADSFDICALIVG
ncbi:MAG: InlB B-repeat-containing protein [Anaeroplasmataceae bacterium]|nr:InlB B-repeat-containing protein [Anaeroplasmataceae bacterium]